MMSVVDMHEHTHTHTYIHTHTIESQLQNNKGQLSILKTQILNKEESKYIFLLT